MALIERIFPGWALKRAQARRALQQIRANFEAARPTRTHPRRASTGSADAVMDMANVNLRGYSRYLDENHDLAVGIYNDLVNRVIGTGLKIEAMTVDRSGDPLDDLNLAIDLDWQEFCEAPETTGELPMCGENGVERLVCRSLVRDGELLIHHVFGRRYPYPSNVQYVFELLESDYLPFEMQAGDPLIVQGVEKDGWGRPVAYHLYREHPNDMGLNGTRSLRASQETIRKRANVITHLKIAKRFRQTRGTPLAHAIITRLADIKEYEESERIAARMNAEIGGVITNAPPALGQVQSDGVESVRELEMANGLWWTQVEGSSVEMMDATRPNTALEAFRDSQVRMLAAGTNTRYSSIAKNYNGTYSSQRQELVEGGVGYDSLREYLIGRFYHVVRRFRIDAAVLAGKITLPRGLDRRSLYWADYRGPPVPQIDISKEMEGRKTAQEMGWTSGVQNTRDLGNDPRIVERQRQREETEQSEVEVGGEEETERGDVVAWRTPA